MPRRTPLTTQVSQLSRQLDRLQKQVSQLQLVNEQAHLEQLLLTSACEVLEAMRERSQHEAERQADEGLLQLLRELRGPLTLAPSGAPSSAAATEASRDRGVDETLAPLSDPLAVLRATSEMEPDPRAPSISLAGFCSTYADLVREMSLFLHTVDLPWCEGASGASLVARARARVDAHLHLLGSICAAKRSDLLMNFVRTDVVTGQKLPALPIELLSWALQELGLTQEQRARVAAGHALFKRIGDRVVSERRQLQQAAAEAMPAAQPGDGPQLPLGMQPARPEDGKAQRHAELLLQLQRAMRKEQVVHTLLGAFVFGALTLRQAAKLAVLTFPFPTSTTAICELLWQQQQQQQQLRPPPPPPPSPQSCKMDAAARAEAGAAAGAVQGMAVKLEPGEVVGAGQLA